MNEHLLLPPSEPGCLPFWEGQIELVIEGGLPLQMSHLLCSGLCGSLALWPKRRNCSDFWSLHTSNCPWSSPENSDTQVAMSGKENKKEGGKKNLSVGDFGGGVRVYKSITQQICWKGKEWTWARRGRLGRGTFNWFINILMESRGNQLKRTDLEHRFPLLQSKLKKQQHRALEAERTWFESWPCHLVSI